MKKTPYLLGRTAPGADAPNSTIGASGAARESAAPRPVLKPRWGLRFSWPMLPVILLGFLVTACGVKSDLAKPNGTTTPKTQNDPSKPPYPLGR